MSAETVWAVDVVTCSFASVGFARVLVVVDGTDLSAECDSSCVVSTTCPLPSAPSHSLIICGER